MPSELRCQSCETVVPTPEASAGETVACPGCGARIFVPTTDTEDAIPLKLPSGISLDHRPGVFGDSETEASAEEPASTDQDAEEGISEGIPRLAIAGSDDDSNETIPLYNPAAELDAETDRKHKPDNSSMVPRLPVIESPDGQEQSTSPGGELRLKHETASEDGVGLSNSHIDMMTSQDNRVWREERAKRQAEEAIQKSIFRFGLLCCGLAATLTISVGLPFVLAASKVRSERAATIAPETSSQPEVEAEEAAESESDRE